jgi:TRAP-type C4-dicarboxylate transport system substrate-binding protein
MKKPFSIVTAIIVTVLAVASLACAETVTLSYSNFFPPTHIQSQLAEQWCKEVEKRTNGKVVINYYPGSTLTKAKQTYDSVVEGIADIGMSAPAYSRGRFPVMEAVDLPLGYTSGAQATRVANAVYEQFKPHEVNDVAVMYFHAHGPGLLFTTPHPVATLEDMKGLKIRSTGNSAKLVQALGGTPVAQSMSTCYQSLQKGVVDGSMHPIESNKGWKLAEVVKFGTESQPVGYTTTFFIVMNKDRWNSLDTDVQQTIREINAEWATKHGAAWDESDTIGREFFKEMGGTFIPLAEGEAARWIEAAKPVMTEYVESVAKKNIDGGKVLECIKKEMAQ